MPNAEKDLTAYIFPRAGKFAIQKVLGENSDGPRHEVFWAEDLTYDEAIILAKDCHTVNLPAMKGISS